MTRGERGESAESRQGSATHHLQRKTPPKFSKKKQYKKEFKDPSSKNGCIFQVEVEGHTIQRSSGRRLEDEPLALEERIMYR